jgi:dihydrofolate reductase|tara:strand:+ start:1019 stop:1513 length:495 start_codon:yes stop_codon:yes gene_type:complete
MIRVIFAVETHMGYSNKGTMPDWKSTADFKHFKESTEGQIVVMGSKTWEDPMMKRPLPNRINCVVSTRDDLINADKINHLISSQDLVSQMRLLERTYPNKDIVIIGGWNIISQCLPVIEKVTLTVMYEKYETDKRLPLGWLIGYGLGKTFKLSDGKGKVVEYIK